MYDIIWSMNTEIYFVYPPVKRVLKKNLIDFIFKSDQQWQNSVCSED